MIVYMDTSALVKRYVQEPGSKDLERFLADGPLVGTAVIAYAEMAAAFAAAVRVQSLARRAATSALRAFQSEWESFVRIQLTEILVARAGSLAWEYGLTGYDATHLAAALFWQELLGEPVCMATYDRQLWDASHLAGLNMFPLERP